MTTPTALFESAFHHAPIGMALFGADGALLKVNPAFCALCGYDEAFLLTTTFQAITPPEDVPESFERMAQLMAGEITNYRIDKRYIRADGSTVWAQVAVSMVREDNASPFFIAQCEDLTDRRRAQDAVRDSELRYRLIAENTSDMIVRSDLTGRINFIASSCEPQTGYSPAEMLGQRPMDFAYPEDVPGVRQVFMELLQGKTGRRALWRVDHRITGQLKWLESYPSLLRDPLTQAPIGFLDVIRDVTDQVLQREALADARAQAEAAAAVKSEFLANMSHEIRTPLNAILGFSDLLGRQPDLGPQSRGFVDQLTCATQGLLAIVNDVLDFSRLEAGQVEIVPTATAPGALAREVLEMFALLAEAKDLSLYLELAEDLPDCVLVDAGRLRQILVNLISNAVKFTRAGSITLSINHDPLARRLSLAVTDTGEGLTVAQQAKLFQRFSQVDGSHTRRHGGTGLGLAICKGLTEAMGGTISVRSQLGQGARFAFDVEAPLASAALIRRTGDSALGLTGMRILVVDDNAANRILARALLEHFGADVRDAPDGKAGVAAAGVEPLDVILMDLRMPEMSGVQALAQIRAEPGPNQATPILAFTAETEVAQGGGHPGFCGVVRKPIVAADLVAAIWRCLSHRADVDSPLAASAA
jgi:PAS domain S-box-containing protein